MLTAPLILISAIRLFYWSARTRLLLRGSTEQINQTLEHDLYLGRRWLSAFR